MFWIFTSTTISDQNWEILSTFCGLLRKLCTQCYLNLIFFVDIENLGKEISWNWRIWRFHKGFGSIVWYLDGTEVIHSLTSKSRVLRSWVETSSVGCFMPFRDTNIMPTHCTLLVFLKFSLRFYTYPHIKVLTDNYGCFGGLLSIKYLRQISILGTKE